MMIILRIMSLGFMLTLCLSYINKRRDLKHNLKLVSGLEWTPDHWAANTWLVLRKNESNNQIRKENLNPRPNFKSIMKSKGTLILQFAY